MTDDTLQIPVAPPARETAPGFAAAHVILKPRKARPFFGRHPWVLDSAIDRVEGIPADGDFVDLWTENRKFVARGIFNSHSKIRVRLYTWDVTQPLDDALWRRRLTAAVASRKRLGLDVPQGAARLVYSEADALSGLVVDRYGEHLCIQATALGMAARLPVLVPILVELTGARGVIVRTEKGVAHAEGLELRDGLYWGELPAGPVFIQENGIKYGVDLSAGQKTGFYLDQRDNRRAVAAYFRDRRVLDMCCYSGGFSLNAAIHGPAREVLAFDCSEKAVALTMANAELNGVTTIRAEVGDAFDKLGFLLSRDHKFGGVILDPPKFARNRASLNDALQAYHRLNRLAVELLEPGGILVTCSCSGHVTREDFLHMLSGVAQQTRRDLQVLEQRGAAADHPVSATCLETEYLKCFVVQAV